MRRHQYVHEFDGKFLAISLNRIEAFLFDWAVAGFRVAVSNLWDTLRTYGTKHVEFS